MATAEITDNLMFKDKKTVADLYNVSIAYINMLLTGERSAKGKTAKRILKDLEILANINQLADAAKHEKLQAA